MNPADAITKVHVIAFGKWTFVQWSAGRETEKPVSLKIRTLLIDGRVKDLYARRAARSDGKAVCSAARFFGE